MVRPPRCAADRDRSRARGETAPRDRAAQRRVDPALVVVRRRVVGVDRQRLVQVQARRIGGLGALLARHPLGPTQRGVVLGLARRPRDHVLICPPPGPTARSPSSPLRCESSARRRSRRRLHQLAARELAVVVGARAAVEQGIARDLVDPPQLVELGAVGGSRITGESRSSSAARAANAASISSGYARRPTISTA